MSARWIALSLCLAVGCSTVKTTFVDRDACGRLVPKKCGCQKGMPAMVKVPTHIKVEIKQQDVWKIVKKGNDPKQLVHIPEATSRSATVEELQIEQMFLIDPKRPVSGQGNFAIGLSNDGKGNLKRVEYKAVDTTIVDTANLITSALATFASPASTAEKTSITNDDQDIVSAERTIAYRHFPIDSCTEAEVEHFINQYINSCSVGDCGEGPLYAK